MAKFSAFHTIANVSVFAQLKHLARPVATSVSRDGHVSMTFNTEQEFNDWSQHVIDGMKRNAPSGLINTGGYLDLKDGKVTITLWKHHTEGTEND